MAIDTIDKVVAGLAAAQTFNYFSPSATNVAGGTVNLQRAVTTSFGQMAIPAAASAGGTLHTDSETGFPKGVEPTGGILSYLAKWESIAATAGTVIMFDRIWSCTGFSGTVATAQAVTSFPTLTRPDNTGAGLEIWIECYTATGSTAANITVQYTNSYGISGRNTVATAHPTSLPANRLYQVPLQSGDVGVRSIQSVTLSGTTGTAGAFGVTLMRRIAAAPMPVPNVSTIQDFAALGMPRIYDYAALNFIHQATTTSSGIIMGAMKFIQG